MKKKLLLLPNIFFLLIVLVFFYLLIIARNPSELPSVLLNKNVPKFETVSLLKNKDFVFAHGKKYQLPDNKFLIGSYHPSPRNVNTGRIDVQKMISLLNDVKKFIKN